MIRAGNLRCIKLPLTYTVLAADANSSSVPIQVYLAPPSPAPTSWQDRFLRSVSYETQTFKICVYDTLVHCTLRWRWAVTVLMVILLIKTSQVWMRLFNSNINCVDRWLKTDRDLSSWNASSVSRLQEKLARERSVPEADWIVNLQQNKQKSHDSARSLSFIALMLLLVLHPLRLMKPASVWSENNFLLWPSAEY